MERPNSGRATIIDNITDLQIIIPSKRNWFIIIFVGAWLGGWLMGEIFALGLLIGTLRGNPLDLFMLFWLTAWTAGGFMAFRAFLWNLIGKEIITVGQGRLAIDKKAALLFKPKIYDLDEVKNVRIKDDNIEFGGLFGGQRNRLSPFNSGGTIKFDYGLQTVKIAGGIDEAEAKFIVEKLKEKHFLTEKNFM